MRHKLIENRKTSNKTKVKDVIADRSSNLDKTMFVSSVGVVLLEMAVMTIFFENTA
jgi:hypothetical protein